MEGLKNRLEALASPQLVAAFNNGDVEKSIFFVKIFADMERSTQLLKYYRKCIRARLAKTWSNYVEDNEQFTILEWSKYFFDHIKSEIGVQCDWFKGVFTDANVEENMIEILLEVFVSLDPSMEFCIDAGLKQQSEPLDYLVQVKANFNDLLEHLDETMLPPNSKSQTRMRELAKLIYAPFKPNISK